MISENAGRLPQFSRSASKHFIMALCTLYVISIQLPLLSPYREIGSDEQIIGDAIYSLASGRRLIPAGYIYAHIIPRSEEYYAAYPPLYLYFTAGWVSVFGFSAVTIGAMHAVLRLSTALLLFYCCRRIGLPAWTSSLLAALWATALNLESYHLIRYEDLALLFLVAGCFVLLGRGSSLSRYIISGIYLGCVLLTYSTYLAPLICFLLLLDEHVHLHADKGWFRFVRVCGALFISAGVVAALWLLWIIPNLEAFKSYFIDFGLPDARTPSFLASFQQFGELVVFGTYATPFPMHYSSLPLIALVAVLALKDSQSGRHWSIMVVIAYVALSWLLLAQIRIHSYNFAWFLAGLIIMGIVLLGRTGVRVIKRHDWAIVVVCVVWFGYQAAGRVALATVNVVADVIGVEAKGVAPHADLLSLVPPGDKVIARQGVVFYALRPTNPIYWPAGLYGVTPGQYQFATTYDDTYQWLVLTSDLHSPDFTENPGAKFAWNDATLGYFRANYRLVASSHIAKDWPLARFSSVTSSLYLYKYTGGTG
ncbi:MAG: hypothetical protein AB1435_00730 [Chloroflexota bacterium]